jgi:DNA-directed RNA polymerase subunit beta'
MRKTTIGQLMINEAIPEEFRDETRVLGKSEMDAVLADIAKKYPERYKDISYKIMQLGREAAFQSGVTLSLNSIMPVMDTRTIMAEIEKAERDIADNKDSTDDEKTAALEEVYTKAQEFIANNTYTEALKANNPFALQVKSKARGSKTQLAALLTSPSVYQDSADKTIPIFIRHSYAEGLSPAEFWAGTYGARKGVVSTKFSTRDAGYLGKQLGNAVADMVVTDEDCETLHGIPVKADDPDNMGAILARPAGKYDAGTILTKQVMADIAKSKADEIIIRSPITCGAHNGVCKHCVGLREDGKLPEIGHHIGQNAASAIAERIAQGQLNVKHTSGQKQTDPNAERTYSGFDIVEDMVQIPRVFPHKASVAEIDGVVEAVEPAPQGGTNVTVGGQLHYVLPEMSVTVKPGDQLEMGDQISTGILNPAEIVKFKGIGEGRRYLAERFTRALRDSGFEVNRRNAEVLARSLVNHVIVDDQDGIGNYLPGEVTRYSALQMNYSPRATAKQLKLSKAHGKYIEEPILHYSVGTRITNEVAKKLTKHGFDTVTVDDNPPAFTPQMASLVKVPEYTEDWMARLGANYLKPRLLKDVHFGAESNIHGLHPLPGVAKGTEFGDQKGKTFTY